MRKGFTLLELIVVVIIIGILATLGFSQYTRVIEKGRVAEAKMLLGQMRTAEEVYMQEYGSRTATIDLLGVGAPTGCSTTHYFSYSTGADTGTAIRCTAGGRTPNAVGAYTVTVTYSTGVWGGSSGYY